MKRLLLLLLLLIAATANSQTTSYSSGRHQYWVGRVPTSRLNVAAGTVYLVHASFSTGGSSGTITVTDRGTDCSGACDFADAVAIAANTTYEMDFNYAVAPNGFSILATGTVDAHIHYSTQVRD